MKKTQLTAPEAVAFLEAHGISFVEALRAVVNGEARETRQQNSLSEQYRRDFIAMSHEERVDWWVGLGKRMRRYYRPHPNDPKNEFNVYYEQQIRLLDEAIGEP